MATITLDKFGTLTSDANLPADATLGLVDQDGRAVLDPTNDGSGAARSLPPPRTLLRQLAIAQPTFDAYGQDGVHRLYAVAPVARDQLNVIIGLPTGGRLAWLDTAALTAMLVPPTLMLAAFAAIWIGTLRLVVRHVADLARSARQWSRGDLDWRPEMADAPFQLRELGAVFGPMAGRIAQREAELTTTLAQKDLLLKEVHHRVKNNPWIVASLLSLRAQAMHQAELRSALSDGQTQIQALALEHRKLYGHNDLATIELADFLAELADLLATAVAPGDASVQIETDIARLRLPADLATPLALLVTEAVTNALRHAFPAAGDGRIVISLAPDAERAVLTITDDGVGLREQTPAEGLGLRLCRMVAKQLGGALEITGPPDTTVRVAFPLAGASAPAGTSSLVDHSAPNSADRPEPARQPGVEASGNGTRGRGNVALSGGCRRSRPAAPSVRAEPQGGAGCACRRPRAGYHRQGARGAGPVHRRLEPARLALHQPAQHTHLSHPRRQKIRNEVGGDSVELFGSVPAFQEGRVEVLAPRGNAARRLSERAAEVAESRLPRPAAMTAAIRSTGVSARPH